MLAAPLDPEEPEVAAGAPALTFSPLTVVVGVVLAEAVLRTDSEFVGV